MSPEFSLIGKYFTRKTKHTDLSVGDDAALISVTQGNQLAISSDMLVAGTHFFEYVAPYDIGWKAMAVNISDMAAMGACAKWATLSLALPHIEEKWLGEFSRGFFDCANSFNIDLIGGDTTRGPLTISVNIMGELPIGKAIRRDKAKVGDDIWVTGALGDAAIGLAHLKKNLHAHLKIDDGYIEYCLNALHKPQPRAEIGLNLIDIAHSAIDISDGLLADLGHILKASHVGASLKLESIPMSTFAYQNLDNAQMQTFTLAGGDDYELCFTAPENARKKIANLSKMTMLPITVIGKITSGTSIEVLNKHNQPITISNLGYDHFTQF